MDSSAAVEEEVVWRRFKLATGVVSEVNTVFIIFDFYLHIHLYITTLNFSPLMN
jgi:hypothetical protein